MTTIKISIEQCSNALDAMTENTHTNQYRRIAVDSDGTVYFSETPEADEKETLRFYAEHLEGADACTLAEHICEMLEECEGLDLIGDVTP